jgi:uncharacterized protein (UPF0333 family)
MISTDNDIKDLVYMLLQNSQLKAEVTGQIIKVSRNPASTNEDVVISVLANDNPRQIQSAYVNVNIYVKDVDFQQSGEKYKVENTARTKELSRIFADMFENAIIGESYRLTLDRQRVIAVEGANEHCVNNRLLYQCVNE